MLWRLMFSCAFVAEACFAELSANEIMARVAENQDKAIELRRYFVYQQHLTVATRHFNGKLAREEKADYQISPGANSEEKKLASITGRYRKKNAYIDFHGEPVPDESSLDGDLVKSFRDDLLNEKSKDGVGKDLFPLTSDEQKQYKFVLTGHKEVQGRDTYVIAFSPLDAQDLTRAGEAWIDVDELQPVRVFTHLSRRMPLFVRAMLGTDLPGVGFNVQYKRLEKDVWFPESFGSEFRLRAVFFIKRDITMSMEASGFRKAQVDTKVQYDAP